MKKARVDPVDFARAIVYNCLARDACNTGGRITADLPDLEVNRDTAQSGHLKKRKIICAK
jgi:hypothetical protein